MSTPYQRTLESYVGSYPRLLRAMKWVACLSDSEAQHCLMNYMKDQEYSGEAVDHYGGTRAVVQAAYAKRHYVAAYYAAYPEAAR